MAEKKPDQNRGLIAFIVVIVAGLIIGEFIKNVRIGLLIGLVFGLLGSGLLKRR